MKHGTFIIIEKDGRLVAAVRRADGGIIELPEVAITPDLQRLNGQPCEYLSKGDKIVKVDGRNIFQAQKAEQPKQQHAPKPAQTDWRQAVRASAKDDEPEIVGNMPKPAWGRNDSFQREKCRVPKDTKALPIRGEAIENFSLKLNQFARFEESQNNRGDWERKFLFFKGKGFQIQTNFGNLFSSPPQLADRQKNAAKALFPTDGNLIEQKFKPAWRFVTGLGGHSVYETGLTLHHIYGIPYIPASSVKGVLRSWVILQKFKNNEGKAIQDKCFCEVFGCPSEVTIEKDNKKNKYKSHFEEARQGKVTFFDALPTRSPTIEPDIMNPHYPNWYGEKAKAPLDTESPVPVFFLTVVNTPFEFLIGSKAWDLSTQKFWDKTLGEWLEEALEEHGIGAKTAVGYGYMKPVP
ncbi:MAG: type III-B CRISPR module RAMP protein Cmr6 [Saprospiraceae bacterium]